MLLLAQFKKGEFDNEKDQSLWSALQRGQQDALSILFKRHHKHLYNYGIKIVHNEEIVNEAIQELFLNLWNSRKSISFADSVRAYLLSSLRRIIMNQLKRNKNRAERNRNYIKGDEKELTFSVEGLLIRKEIAQEKREQLERGIKTLTSRQKEAIFLKYYHGLTNKELVEVMEINYQCVRNLLYEALKRLRSNFDPVSYQN